MSEDHMTDYMDFDRFVQTYELRLDREFDYDDVVSFWAPSTQGGPSLWGEELDTFPLSADDPMPEEIEQPHAGFSISPDNRFMAVATNAVVKIYDVELKSLTAELEGHEDVIWAIHFWEIDTWGDKESVPEAHYVVISQDADCLTVDGLIICWHLDKDGRHVGNTNGPINFEGRFIRGNVLALSCDKRRFLYTDRSLSTQDWARPSDWLPQIVIRSLSDPSTEALRLKGHRDAIVWASWSPTDPRIIVSASSDQSIGIWNTTTGERIHNITLTSQQNFTGDFSPDGRQILCSGRERTGELEIAIYSVETGLKVLNIKPTMPISGGWGVPLSWSPSGDTIAFGHNRSVMLWHIPTNRITEILKVHSDGGMRDNYCRIVRVKWIDRHGNKMLVRVTDSTILVWDRQRNWKWRLQRPAEVKEMTPYSTAEVFDEEKGILWSLDGDRQIRIWTIE